MRSACLAVQTSGLGLLRIAVGVTYGSEGPLCGVPNTTAALISHSGWQVRRGGASPREGACVCWIPWRLPQVPIWTRAPQLVSLARKVLARLEGASYELAFLSNCYSCMALCSMRIKVAAQFDEDRTGVTVMVRSR